MTTNAQEWLYDASEAAIVAIEKRIAANRETVSDYCAAYADGLRAPSPRFGSPPRNGAT